MIALSAACAALIVLLLGLVRLFFGPTFYDRVVAANAVAICVVVILAALGVAAGDSRALDAGIALVLALLVANVAMFKFSYARTFQSAIARVEDSL
ncbi:MAG: cation:proton antiporter [Proteobacteria bacterium]|nr:cation:proton antiporter [Pseudomonadota bacterium]